MLFEKNLRILEKENSFLLKGLTEFFCEKRAQIDTDQIQWGEDLFAKDVPYVRAEDGAYIRLCSQYSVCHELEIWLQQYDEILKDDSLIYIMGLGTGEAVRMISDRISDDGAVVIYEPNVELFFQLMERHDFTDIFSKPNVYLFLEEVNENGIVPLLTDYCSRHWILPSDIVVMYLPSYQKAYPGAKKRFDDYWLEWRYFRDTDHATTRFFLKDKVSAPLEKLYFYKNAILMEKVKKDWNQDTPVVIIGAGPSLRKNIKYLHRAKGHMLLVAVDRALVTLSKEGIIPDIIVDIDSLVAFSKGQEEYRDVPYMCSVSTGRESFDWNRGEKIIVPNGTWAYELMEKAGISNEPFSSFGSVAIVAFGIFVMLETKNIIFVGQDLAYSEDGNSHAEGLEAGSESEQIYMLSGYYGKSVASRHDWFMFWKWYQQNIPKLKDTRVINATEGGAHIPGTVQMSLREVVDKFGGFKLDKSFLHDEKYRVSKQEYEKMQEGQEEFRDEMDELCTWTKEDFDERKEEIFDMKIGALVNELICSLMEEEQGVVWNSFQRVLDLFRDNGWTREER